jgi:hypothetical protein
MDLEPEFFLNIENDKEKPLNTLTPTIQVEPMQLKEK